MIYILHIDTASTAALACLSRDGQLICSRLNEQQKDHASFIHPAIQEILNEAAIDISRVDAIAVTEGPGSYTGLRVGLSTAKGLAFALKKPLITIDSLFLAAHAVQQSYGSVAVWAMIDARRNEVFTAVYDEDLQPVLPPVAVELSSEILNTYYKEGLVFTGSGALKGVKFLKEGITAVTFQPEIASSFCIIAYKKYSDKNFADVAYSEPLYIKEFYSGKS